MSPASLKVTIDDRSGDKLTKVIARLKNRGDDLAHDTAQEIAHRARRHCPVDTGRLRSSINVSRAVGGWDVSVNANYAEFVEYGTRYQMPQPFFHRSVAEARLTMRFDLKGLISSVLPNR